MAAWYHNQTLIYKMILFIIINYAVINIFVYKSLSTFLMIPTEKSLEADYYASVRTI